MVLAGKWEARVGSWKNRFLGSYKDEETAACHYDRALVRLKGASAVTNFPLKEYQDQLKEHKKNGKVS